MKYKKNMNNLYDIFISYNRDMFLDMFDEIKNVAAYSPYLNLPTANSSDFFDIICDNIIFLEPKHEDDDEYDENDYYNFET